ncbi:hypothetical protein O181_040132 [Austropuccinia psidii MF-1]|uniref:Uncharacterized protein n=1 Tax=Austropuccinia psidii MF-1 TaxID=1389203 RepID=A0A9Q3DI64_9BASI|nr:hypothetical protein [Austropuccinia psidii MF-1]
MQHIVLTQSKKKGNRRGSISSTPAGSPSEPTSPRHVRPEESPSSSTPGPRDKSPPETEPRPKPHQRRVFSSTPTNPSPLQHQILREERPVVKIKGKDHNLSSNGEKVEKFIRKFERIAQIQGSREEDLETQIAF